MADEVVQQVPGWLKEYNKAVSKKAPNTGGPAGPGFCAVFCTFFCTFGALFLFVVAGLMRNDYRYIHIHGDLPTMSKSVTYAGFVYLVGAVVSVCMWVRGSVKSRNAALSSQMH